MPSGFAGLVMVATLSTSCSASAPATTVVVLAVGCAGLAAGASRLRSVRPEPALLLLACGVFAIFAAPIVLAGDATFAGYGVLGDTAIQLVGIDRLLDAGHTVNGLAPLSYQAALDAYFAAGYPFGAQVAVGARAPLVGEDVAWLYQPGLAFIAACLGLSLYPLARSLLPSRRLSAAVAFVAAQPALVYAFALQGSIKELAAVALVALLAALTVAFAAAIRTAPGSLQVGLPLAVALAAVLAVLGPAAAVWAGPLLLAALVVLMSERRSSRRASQIAVFGAVTLVLSAPTVAQLRSYFDVAAGVVTTDTELGNLIGRLDPLQTIGIWINGDYRLLPSGRWLTITHLLLALAVLGIFAGIACAIRRRAGCCCSTPPWRRSGSSWWRSPARPGRRRRRS